MFKNKTTQLILFIVFTLFAVLSIKAQEQTNKTFIGAGINITHSSSSVPNGDTFPGVYAEAGLNLPKRFQARFLFTADNEAQLPTIYTRDKGLRTPNAEIRFRSQLRYYLPKLNYLTPFVSGGVELSKQLFPQTPQTTHTYKPYPEAGLNPLAGIGLGINNHEASYTHIFQDNSVFNKSKLSGHRANYSYIHRLNNRLSLKATGEADYVSFREHDGSYGDYYREKDIVWKVRLGFIFHNDGK